MFLYRPQNILLRGMKYCAPFLEENCTTDLDSFTYSLKKSVEHTTEHDIDSTYGVCIH